MPWCQVDVSRWFSLDVTAAAYPAENIVELLRLVHHMMQNVHPRPLAGHGQGKDGAPVYDYTNRSFLSGQQQAWEPCGDPSVLLHFLGGGGSVSASEDGEDPPCIDVSSHGIQHCISQLAEAASLKLVSKPVTIADEEPTLARSAKGRRRRLYLAPRVYQLIVSAPTQGLMLLHTPNLLVTHVRLRSLE